MKRLKFLLPVLLVLTGTLRAQKVKSPWIIEIGFNALDDSGYKLSRPEGYKSFFYIKTAWNAVPYPSRISLEKTFTGGVSLQGAFTVNKLKSGKIIDGDINRVTANYRALDLSVKYDLFSSFRKELWFRPFLISGFGYTHKDATTSYPKEDGITLNLGMGFNIWFQQKVSLSFQSLGKFKSHSNLLQHSVSVGCKFHQKKKNRYMR